jgi:hypothetical protein
LIIFTGRTVKRIGGSPPARRPLQLNPYALEIFFFTNSSKRHYLKIVLQ